MMKNIKEVDYNKYCRECKHEKSEENESPCNECLEQGYNFNSHKPIRFEDK